MKPRELTLVFQNLQKAFRLILSSPIYIYRLILSPLLGQRCKYYPSCSQYGLDAIKANGLLGVVFIVWRLLRCNPFSNGGVDYYKTINFGSLHKVKREVGA
jgi:putative membrane protein insertion efficiency factor